MPVGNGGAGVSGLSLSSPLFIFYWVNAKLFFSYPNRTAIGLSVVVFYFVF